MIRRRLCENCKAVVIGRHVAPNHALHLLCSLVTAGAWLLPWLMITASANDYLCETCGSATAPVRDAKATDEKFMEALGLTVVFLIGLGVAMFSLLR